MKDKFISIYNEYIKRPGADKLLEWLDTTDFYTAPASTRFHGSYEGGLVEHSIAVFERLSVLCSSEYGSDMIDKLETIAIVSLLHDLCKIGCYKVDYRNAKNEQGVWEKVPYYAFEEKFAYGGHGAKSVYIIERFMRLTADEAVAIHNHMGAYDRLGGDYSLGNAYEQYPLALLLHTADQFATYIDKK